MMVLVLIGFGVRAWQFPRWGLIHFDEGVYAISGLWGLTPFGEAGFYAKQVLFSPPLFVALVGLSYRILGEPADKAAILVNVLLGVATIALTWRIARRWFGRAAGIAAAALVALSDYQISYARTALTDVAFGFFFLLSLAWLVITFETGQIRWAALSGLAVGAAWNTKYHGWLPLFIALLALGASAATTRHDRSVWKRLFMCWLLAAAVAVACYLPWALYVQKQPGGYFALMKYQRTFLNLHWLKNLWRQAEMQWYMDGWLSRLSPAIAYLLAIASEDNRRQLSWIVIALSVGALLGSGFLLGGIGTATGLAILVAPRLWKRGIFSSWVALCALVVLLFSTPFYRPYARLLMPLTLCLYLVASAGIQSLVSERTSDLAGEEPMPSRRRKLSLLAAGAGLLLVLLLLVGFRPAPRTWMATDSVRQAVAAMLGLLPSDSVVFVHGAPEVAFYFKTAGRKAVAIDEPIDHPSIRSQFHRQGGQNFLITGVYSLREPRSRASLGRLANQLHLIGVFPVEPNEVRLLDDFSPSNALRYRMRPTQEYDLHLFRIDSLPETEAKQRDGS